MFESWLTWWAAGDSNCFCDDRQGATGRAASAAGRWSSACGGGGGDRLHHRQHEVEQRAGIEQMRGRVADAAARVAGPLRGIRLPAARRSGPANGDERARWCRTPPPTARCGGQPRAPAPGSARRACPATSSTCSAWWRNVTGVVVAAEQEDAPTERYEPRQRRPVTVRVVPRLRPEHVSSVWSAADETDDVVVGDRARPRPQTARRAPRCRAANGPCARRTAAATLAGASSTSAGSVPVPT